VQRALDGDAHLSGGFASLDAHALQADCAKKLERYRLHCAESGRRKGQKDALVYRAGNPVKLFA
jgi:hypothetical protein